MDKNIIIDGVDVSGCIYKKDGIADCGMFACGDFRCEGQICLYKQLKRLEAENAKLEEALEEIRKLNSSCADCDCYNACGVCSNAEEKPYRSFKIADEVLKDE